MRSTCSRKPCLFHPRQQPTTSIQLVTPSMGYNSDQRPAQGQHSLHQINITFHVFQHSSLPLRNKLMVRQPDVRLIQYFNIAA